MRTDLPSMNAGKAMAQASHASNAFIYKYKEELSNREFSNERQILKQRISSWERQTKQGFGTVLVLGCENKDIVEFLEKKKSSRVFYGAVFDPTYPYIVNKEIKNLVSKNNTDEPLELESGDFVCFREERTCAFLFGKKGSEEVEELVGHLKLHP